MAEPIRSGIEASHSAVEKVKRSGSNKNAAPVVHQGGVLLVWR